MERTTQLLAGAGLGAALMYFLDPRQGRRRRAVMRDRLVHLAREARQAADIAARDAANRASGLVAAARETISGQTPDDRTLVERIRSRLGRCVSHPRAIDVSVANGAVTLSGPILASEVDDLLACVEGKPGVSQVNNQLEVHDRAGNHPSLQGGVAPDRFLHTNWSPALRALGGAVGVGLMVNCLAQRKLVSALLGTVGFGLFLRAATNTGPADWIHEAMPADSTGGNSELWTAAAAGPVL